MKKTESNRQVVIEKIADHLLVHGLKGSSLRKMAATAKTSDRMLLYYFADKRELMTAALTQVTARLVTLLESARSEKMTFQIFLPHLAKMMKDPRVRPYLRLSLELAALASEEKESYGAIARKMVRFFGLDCFGPASGTGRRSHFLGSARIGNDGRFYALGCSRLRFNNH